MRKAIASGEMRPDDEVSLAGSSLEGEEFWAPAVAWTILDLDASPPPRHTPELLEAPAAISELDGAVRDGLRWWLRDGGLVQGPLPTSELRERLASRIGASRMVAMVGGDCWFPPAILQGRASWRAQAKSVAPSIDCPICLESIPADAKRCPECSEQLEPPSSLVPSTTAPAGAAPSSGSTGGAPAAMGFWRLHWRPMTTMVAVGGLLTAGVALRHLAPERYQPPEPMAPQTAAAEPGCESTCWHGEACQMGRCVWQPANSAGHLGPELSVTGPFKLPAEVVDVLPLDAERFAASSLRGIEISNARTGAALGLVSEAPHAQSMFRVGDVVYAAAPRRLYVMDVASTQVLKTIEVGHEVSDVAIDASAQRVLAALPGAKAVSVISTDYHAEVSRFFFGDDHVRTVALGATGERALTANGVIPLAGLKPSRQADRHGAMYAFDPSMLPSAQDKVRTGLVGNPVDVVMAPDETSSFVVLREKDTVVRLERMANGAVRQVAHWKTCRQPEQLALVRLGRRLAVRCDLGRAIEIFDIDAGQRIEHIDLNARAADMAASPDGEELLVALPHDGDGTGALGVIDLQSYELTLHELRGEPHRIRTTPDGSTAVVISDRTKAAWVIR